MLPTIVFVCSILASVSADSRVVMGSDAEEGEFPYAVSLRRQGSHTCGATILNEKYVLTAAHCVCSDQEPKNSSLYSIQYDLLTITKEPVNTIPVKKINCHQFSSEKLIFDSAVLELETPIPSGKWKPVTISKDFSTAKRQKGTIIGWGRLYQDGPISEKLQKLNVQIYDDNTCGRRYNNEHHICFGALAGGACNGDSGTALIVEGVQVGIASFITDMCGIANEMHPNVYSRISTYYDWIHTISE
ncbi:chymotrypsin-2-like [Diabrotica virgifera virgifera]|uniref:Peptidase S1 domain-containing protein n=1 Tax=Diabrotica virgifera virgifera TaxID=50390 RepID=A0ABM5K8Q5_DIAVI|nr:chymotrypsin-2-like [Diabrotica virgifera virgifera]